jgi:hypothetical protein
MHLAYYKPYFIQKTLNKYNSADKFFYFDVDIVINAHWSFFSNWLEGDVCFCIDNNFPFVHSNHPWRKDWLKLNIANPAIANATDYYVNTGFMAITRRNIKLLDKWIYLTEKYEETGGNLKVVNQDGHRSFKGDQDILNAALTVLPDLPISLIGTEGMGFSHPAYLMTHAIGNIKPWNKTFLSHLIRYGQKPTNAEKNFFNYCHHPLKVFTKTTFILKKIDLFFATIFGRFIGY